MEEGEKQFFKKRIGGKVMKIGYGKAGKKVFVEDEWYYLKPYTKMELFKGDSIFKDSMSFIVNVYKVKE